MAKKNKKPKTRGDKNYNLRKKRKKLMNKKEHNNYASFN